MINTVVKQLLGTEMERVKCVSSQQSLSVSDQPNFHWCCFTAPLLRPCRTGLNPNYY